MKNTDEMSFWKGEFGDGFVDRCEQDWDIVFKEFYGITRTELNELFLSGLDKNIPILEVGCNRGLQLDILKRNGFNNLWGIEINKKALLIAKEKKSFNVIEGSGFDIPFKDNYFDITFTSVVLIHINPKDLSKIMDEIYRTSKKYIWGFEYYSEKCEVITYRGHKDRMWRNNFMKLFLDRYPDLTIVKQKKLKYLESDNLDIMYLLKKNDK